MFNRYFSADAAGLHFSPKRENWLFFLFFFSLLAEYVPAQLIRRRVTAVTNQL